MRINVNLYGGFNNNDRNRAEIIHCDKCNECGLYKEGKCINVTVPFSKRCKIGKIETIQGYTKRAKSRYNFDEKYKTDECYNKLEYPSSSSWAYREVGDIILLNLVWAVVEKRDYSGWEWKETEDFRVRSCSILGTGEISYIPKEEFTIELLYKICTLTVRSMSGGVISEYNAERIALLLRDMKKFNQSLYKAFTEKYPEFADKPVNAVGKYAYLYTLNKDCLYDGFSFSEDGAKLIKENYRSAFLPFGAKTAKIEIEITKDMKFKITDNAQVMEDTIFC